MARSRVPLEDWEAQRPDLDAEVQGIRTRLLAVSARLARDNHGLARTVGLSGAELRVLYALRRAGPPFELRPTDLFESLVVPSGTMTRQIDRLDRLGYVVRGDDPDDRRGARVRLTERGRVVADDTLTVAVRDSRSSKCIERLAPVDRTALARVLKSLLAVMDEFDDRGLERDDEQGVGPA
jgi:DNA-binding MarR family transcriptional regulator